MVDRHLQDMIAELAAAGVALWIHIGPDGTPALVVDHGAPRTAPRPPLDEHIAAVGAHLEQLVRTGCPDAQPGMWYRLLPA